MLSASEGSIDAFLKQSGRRLKTIEGDGNCQFRCFSYQLFGSEEHHLSVRFLLERFENLNKGVFAKYLTPVNKPTIDEHIRHIGRPKSWGTHIELIAAATYFQVCVYYCSQHPQSKEFKWRCIQPLHPRTQVHYPLIVEDPPAEITVPHHFELVHTGVHYDCVDLASTGTVSQVPPVETGQIIEHCTYIL